MKKMICLAVLLLLFAANAEARMYNAVAGRWMSRDPIGEGGNAVIAATVPDPYIVAPSVPQTNLYNFVGNNPRNKIDPLGLSERDVNIIYSNYYNSIEDMNKSGQRYWYPYWNNTSRSIYDLTGGRLGKKYLGCGEQEEYVKDRLGKNKYDDKWNFEWQGSLLPPHQWLKATSSNPNDPIITIDPWKDNISQKPGK